MYFTVLHFYKIAFVSDMFKMFTAIVYFILLKYMLSLSFRLINLFYSVSGIICCMFLRGLGKHLLLRLDKIVYQFTFFVILDPLLHFYCIAFMEWNLLKVKHGKIRHKDEHILFLWRILPCCTLGKFHLSQMPGKDLINDY